MSPLSKFWKSLTSRKRSYVLLEFYPALGWFLLALKLLDNHFQLESFIWKCICLNFSIGGCLIVIIMEFDHDYQEANLLRHSWHLATEK